MSGCVLFGGEGKRPHPAITDKTWVSPIRIPITLCPWAALPLRLPSCSVTQAMGRSPLPLGFGPTKALCSSSKCFPAASQPQAPFLRGLQLPHCATRLDSSGLWAELVASIFGTFTWGSLLSLLLLGLYRELKKMVSLVAPSGD